jgi:hypothetical protein
VPDVETLRFFDTELKLLFSPAIEALEISIYRRGGNEIVASHVPSHIASHDGGRAARCGAQYRAGTGACRAGVPSGKKDNDKNELTNFCALGTRPPW